MYVRTAIQANMGPNPAVLPRVILLAFVFSINLNIRDFSDKLPLDHSLAVYFISIRRGLFQQKVFSSDQTSGIIFNMLAARYRDTPIGGVERVGTADKREMKLVFQTHFLRFDNVNDKAMVDLKSKPLPGPRTSSVPTVITCWPETSGEEQKYNEEDLDSVDEFKVCLDLLESKLYEDNRYGIERLMKLVNSELVNSKKSGSIAHALLCGDSSKAETERLRNVFLSYFCESINPHTSRDSFDEDESSEESSRYSDFEESAGRHMGSLKLPALRVVASTLELLAGLEKKENKVDLSSTFWRRVLGSIVGMLEVVSVRSIEATLSIKCIRLLRKLEPKTIDPYIRYSLLPLVLHAYQFGISGGDRMLVRESERLLKPLGVTP
jgi:hypothetical protein